MADPRDEVDRIVAAWHTERPDLDVAPLEILSRVTRLARQLDLARREAFARHDLEVWQFDVLTALRRAGAPYEATPSALMADTLVSSGTMTNRIDRLAALGLVVRLSDPDDGRQVRVRLTPAGVERADAAFTELLARERALLASLSGSQRTTLATLLRRVLTTFP